VGNGVNPQRSLYQLHELSIRTHYAEVKERASSVDELLPGTPGTLVKRAGTGHTYWYRSYYPVPKKRSEAFVGSEDDQAAYETMRDRIEFSEWISKQVSTLSKLGFQVADKSVACVLVQLQNQGMFEAGLVLVGTLAYMGWLNEYGARTAIARTQDIDVARPKSLKLAATVPFLSSMRATQLPFKGVPGLPSHRPSTSVMLRGIDGLRVDVVAPGPVLGTIIAVPELDWHAQAIPYYDYLLEDSRNGAILAGGHCVPVKLPAATRMIWHKFYASTHRTHDPTKAEKDLIQAATVAAILVEQESTLLRESFRDAPLSLRKATLSRLSRIAALLAEHPQAAEAFRELR
jgi:hypothetical protein